MKFLESDSPDVSGWKELPVGKSGRMAGLVD